MKKNRINGTGKFLRKWKLADYFRQLIFDAKYGSDITMRCIKCVVNAKNSNERVTFLFAPVICFLIYSYLRMIFPDRYVDFCKANKR